MMSGWRARRGPYPKGFESNFSRNYDGVGEVYNSPFTETKVNVSGPNQVRSLVALCFQIESLLLKCLM
jgi:hypothetical protein